MPAFRWLRDEDLQPLIDYVVLLSQRGELEEDLLYYAETELELEDDPETTDIEEDSFYQEDVAEMVVALNDEWATAGDQLVLPVTRRPEYSDESILARAEKRFWTVVAQNATAMMVEAIRRRTSEKTIGATSLTPPI